ncbi:hypothetical protein [Thermosporothrix hazakensis]|jgi:hypothetical protein|nr:hypothetical protein [Thermosporothrix hazakensis]
MFTEKPALFIEKQALSMVKAMYLTQELGEIVQQYGRFQLREVLVCKGERVLRSALLQLSLVLASGEELVIAYLTSRGGRPDDVIERVQSWLVGQQRQIEEAKLWLTEMDDRETIERFTMLLEQWEPCYTEVSRALEELS